MMSYLHRDKLPNPALRVTQRAPMYNLPVEGCALVQGYYESCHQMGRKHLAIVLDGVIPKSLNHQYIRKGQARGGRYDFDPEVKMLRDLVRYTVASEEAKIGRFAPTGVLAAVIALESDHWLTKERKARMEDIDNKVKPLMDAIEKATGIGDERYWAIHVFKIQSKKPRTVVRLFDLGDIVETYG